MLIESDTVVDKLVDKVKDKLSSLPHKEEVKKVKEYQEKLKIATDEIKKYKRKLNRKKKELQIISNREKRLEENVKELENKLFKTEDIIKKLEKKVKWYKDKYKEKEKDFNKIENELKGYKDKEELYKEKGINKEDLIEKINNLQKQIENEKVKREQEVKHREDRIKKLKQNIKGEKRAKERKERELQEITNRLEKFKVKLEKEVKDKKEFKMKHDTLTQKVKEVRNELNEFKKDKEKVLKYLIEELTEDNVVEFELIDTLTNKYKNIQHSLKKKNMIAGKELGYILKENEKYYFISLEDDVARVVDDDSGYKMYDGMVCKVEVYKDNSVKILSEYDTEKITEEYTQDKKERIKKVQRSVKEKRDLGKDFFEEVHKYATLIITSKNIRNYKEYFYRYGVINVVDPYGEGDRKIITDIDKSDIIVVRTDAVPHWVTNYIKSNCKDKTLFMYNVKSKDIAQAIYNKAKSLSIKNRLEKE